MRKLIRRPYTPEEDAKLLRLFRQGKSTVLIAATLRRSPSAVQSRKNQL